MKTSIKEILTKELVGNQILVNKYYSEIDKHSVIRSSCIEPRLGLNYVLVKSYYATIVGVYLGTSNAAGDAFVVLELEDKKEVEVRWNELNIDYEETIDFKERED